MGFLHEGHLSLMRIARQNADRVVTTIFVDIALIVLHFIMPDLLSLPVAVTLGAIAAATAPAFAISRIFSASSFSVMSVPF